MNHALHYKDGEESVSESDPPNTQTHKEGEKSIICSDLNAPDHDGFDPWEGVSSSTSHSQSTSSSYNFFLFTGHTDKPLNLPHR